MFCASVSDGLRSSSGPRSALRTLRLRLALGSCAHGSAEPVRIGIQSRAGDLRLQPQRRAPCARRRAFELCRPLAGRNHAVDAEQRQQRAALRRRQFRLDPDLAAPERCEIDAVDRRDRRLGGDGGDALEQRRVDIDDGARIGAIGLTAFLSRSSASFSARRSRRGAHRVEPRDQRRRKRRDQAGELTERGGAGIDLQFSGRIGAVEIAGAFQHHAVGPADLQLLERKRFRPVTEFCQQRTQFLTGRNRGADIERERAFVRPVALRSRQRPDERGGRIDDPAVPPSIAHRPWSRCWPAGATPQPALRRRRRRYRPSRRRR